ncbi:MAG: DUF1206 domain-containing protein [Mycobacteriales bacterium]
MTVEQAARRAEGSTAAEWGARAGIVGRGVLWLTVGLLALGVALGRGGQADKNGALAALRDQPFGQVLLVALAVAFAAHAGFRLLEGTVGRREEQDERKRWLKRAWSLCRVVVYGALAATTVRFLTSGGGSQDARRPTAEVMKMSGGRWLVGAVGAAVVIGGLVLLVKGVRQDFTDKLQMPGGRLRRFVEVTGAVGLAGRGLVYALVGSFLVEAAWTYDPDKAKGLDAALKTLAQQAYGTVLLLVAVVGMLAFAVWSFLEARYRRL